MKSKEPFKILTSDILITDKIISFADNPQHTQALESLVKEFNINPDDKEPLTLEQFGRFKARLDAMEGLNISSEPGGSSANTVVTANKLLGPNRVASTFLGVVGHTKDDKIIRKSLSDAGVHLEEAKAASGDESKSATSYVIVFPNRKRSIVTYPGNAKEILDKSIIAKELVAKHDALLVQGGLWEKFNWDFADELLKQRWQQNKELYLCLPTKAKFGELQHEHFERLIPSANVVLSNDDELAITYHTMTADEKKIWTKQEEKGATEKIREEASIKLEHARREARHKLQDTFANHSALNENPNIDQRQIAYVTRGGRGISIITKDSIQDVPASKIDKMVNNLGAGDTCFAGILAGHIQGLHKRQCAEMGNYLAAAKMGKNGARLDDPRAALEEIAPHAAAKLFADEQVRQIL